MAVTHADYDRLKKRNTELETENRTLADNLAKAEKSVVKSASVVKHLRTALTGAEAKVKELRAELQSRPEILEEEVVQGPSDGPRWMYRADEEDPQGTLFQDMASAEAAEKHEPGVWHSSRHDAMQAYAKRELTPVE